MTANTPRQAELVVTNGPMCGRHFVLPVGRVAVGRDHGSAIELDAAEISRQHAVLDSTGEHVFLTDLGSANGTWVNGDRVTGPVELQDGDVLGLGALSMRFTVPRQASVGEPGRSYGFGDVHGPVQTGNGQQIVSGRDQYVAQRLIHDQSVSLTADYDPSDELFSGKGFGRVLMALGWIIALTGFGALMYFIFTATSAPDSSGQLTDPFARELVPGVPFVAAAFGAFLIGGILAGIGSGMSKAARKRAAARERQRGWQG
jgi:hypothetical protein